MQQYAIHPAILMINRHDQQRLHQMLTQHTSHSRMLLYLAGRVLLAPPPAASATGNDPQGKPAAWVPVMISPAAAALPHIRAQVRVSVTVLLLYIFIHVIYIYMVVSVHTYAIYIYMYIYVYSTLTTIGHTTFILYVPRVSKDIHIGIIPPPPSYHHHHHHPHRRRWCFWVLMTMGMLCLLQMCHQALMII